MQSHRLQQPFDRVVLFSDAVFAIAITLLVIEIRLPEISNRASDALYWQALAALIPNFVGFAVSFAVIGAFWAGHHRSFSLAAQFDRRIMLPNLLLLGAIALMPFLTAFMSAHNGRVVPATLYWGWLILTALLSLRVNGIVTSAPMVGEDVPADVSAAVRRRSRSVILAAMTAFCLAFVIPRVAFVGMATIPAWFALLKTIDGRSRRAAPQP